MTPLRLKEETMSVDRQYGVPATYPRRPRPRPLVDLVDTYEAATIVRGAPAPRPRISGRLLLGGIIVCGVMAQHALVSMPVEAQPARLAAGAVIPGAASADAVAPAPPHAPIVSLQATGAPGRAGALSAAQPNVVHPHPVNLAPSASSRRAAPGTVRAVRGDGKASAPVTSMSGVHGARLAMPSTTKAKLSALLPAVGLAGDLKRIALTSNDGGALLHVPSVSAAAIRQALRDANSPLLDATFVDHKDAAEYIWDEGRVLGIDPAVMLGIFAHESGMGTQGMARATRSIGNIRPVGNQPQINGYRLYASWQEGIDDCYRLLRQYALHGASTVATAIPVWAPPADNNDDSAYISNVLNTMNALNGASNAS